MAYDTPVHEPSLAGKVALVTGGTRGLGLDTSRQLAERGVHVIVAARDPAKAESIAAGLRSDSLQASALRLDVTSAADREAAVAAIEALHGRLAACRSWFRILCRGGFGDTLGQGF